MRLDRDGDGLADSTLAFAGHFDPDCQMVWELDDGGSVEQMDYLNRLTPENEGPHGVAFALLDRDGDGVPDVTRVFYTGELTHRCTAYEIDVRERRARVLGHFSEGDCCRSILSQRLDLDGDGAQRHHTALCEPYRPAGRGIRGPSRYLTCRMTPTSSDTAIEYQELGPRKSESSGPLGPRWSVSISMAMGDSIPHGTSPAPRGTMRSKGAAT